MSEPTLTEAFGSGTIQDADSITILKKNLIGLEAKTENTSEQIIAGLTLKLATTFSEANQTSNPDQQVTVVDARFTESIERNGKTYKQITYNFQFQTEDSTAGLNLSGLDPNKY